MHKMRRSAQELSVKETVRLFEEGTSGVLALIDSDGLPYAVPLSYVFVENGRLSAPSETAAFGDGAEAAAFGDSAGATGFGKGDGVVVSADGESAGPVGCESAGSVDCPSACSADDAEARPVIYFHTALEGHKVGALRINEAVSFCVIGTDDIIPEQFTTAYRSAIAFGRARFVDDPSEKHASLYALGKKYYPEGTDEELFAEMAKGGSRLYMVRIDIDRMTGKEGIELVRARKRAPQHAAE